MGSASTSSLKSVPEGSEAVVAGRSKSEIVNIPLVSERPRPAARRSILSIREAMLGVEERERRGSVSVSISTRSTVSALDAPKEAEVLEDVAPLPNRKEAGEKVTQ